MARPTFTFTEKQIAEIERLAAVLNQSQMADFFGITDRTFRAAAKRDERVASAYKKGKAQAVAGVATNLIQQARKGNITAQIFYLKTQAGWKETQVLEVADIKQLTDEQLAAIVEAKS